MTVIKLDSLTISDVVPQQTEQEILNETLADLQARDPDYNIIKTDPSYNVIATCSYREFVKTTEFNDVIKGLYLGHGKGTALDFIGNTYHLTSRLVIDAGDPNATPPIDPIYESDADYTNRIALAGDAYSTAGGSGSYIYFAKSASGLVKDISLISPSPVTVDVVVLSHVGDGLPDAALITAVTNALHDDRRPLTDQLLVQAADIITYSVDATLTIYTGFDSATILTAAQASLDLWIADQHALGRDITIIGLGAALKVAGVHDVVFNNTDGAIIGNLTVTDYRAAYCTGTTVVIGGTGE